MLASYSSKRPLARGDEPGAPEAEGKRPCPGGAEEALSAVLLSPSETIGSFERDWLLALYEEHLKAPATRRSAALNRFLQAAARLLARSKPISVLQVWVFGGRVWVATLRLGCLGAFLSLVLREC